MRGTRKPRGFIEAGSRNPVSKLHFRKNTFINKALISRNDAAREAPGPSGKRESGGDPRDVFGKPGK